MYHSTQATAEYQEILNELEVQNTQRVALARIQQQTDSLKTDTHNLGHLKNLKQVCYALQSIQCCNNDTFDLLSTEIIQAFNTALAVYQQEHNLPEIPILELVTDDDYYDNYSDYVDLLAILWCEDDFKPLNTQQSSDIILKDHSEVLFEQLYLTSGRIYNIYSGQLFDDRYFASYGLGGMLTSSELSLQKINEKIEEQNQKIETLQQAIAPELLHKICPEPITVPKLISGQNGVEITNPLTQHQEKIGNLSNIWENTKCLESCTGNLVMKRIVYALHVELDNDLDILLEDTEEEFSQFLTQVTTQLLGEMAQRIQYTYHCSLLDKDLQARLLSLYNLITQHLSDEHAELEDNTPDHYQATPSRPH